MAHAHRGLRRRSVAVLVIACALFGCASKNKKKAAEPEHAYEDSIPKWESAGETMPPEKTPPPPPPPPASTGSAATAAGKGPPGKVGAVAAPEPGKTPAKPTAGVVAPPPRPAVAAAPAGKGATGKIDMKALLTPPDEFETVRGASASEPKPTPKAEVKSEPKAEPKPEPRVERVEPRVSDRESERERERDKERERERAERDPPRSRDPEPEPEPRRKRSISDEPPPRDEREEPIPLPASAKRGDLRGSIGGKRVVFRRSTILGNRRHGYALQAFESNSSSSKSGELDVRLDVPELVKGKLIPVTLIYLQIADDGPRSAQGVRQLTCQGRGSMILDAIPQLPKKLPRREELDAGDADGALSVQVVCSRDSKEFGVFTVEGRILSRVMITPPDL